MHLKRIALLVAACSITGVAAAQSSAAPDLSWGKAGVSFDDYRADAIACATEAVNLDISDTEGAQRLVQASRRLESLDNAVTGPNPYDFGADYGRVMEVYRPRRQFEQIESVQQQTLDACLIQHGYRQFQLTDEQRQRLRRLERGSDERRIYLHSLGSDPQVLNQQAI